MAFIFFQSSKRKNAIDCPVRSIMAAEGLTWETAFNMLVKTALKEQNMPSDSSVIEKTLKKIGYEKRKAEMLMTGSRKRRQTVEEFAKKHKKGTYILSLVSHVVCVKDGDWYDTWDCSDYKVFKYWEKL